MVRCLARQSRKRLGLGRLYTSATQFGIVQDATDLVKMSASTAVFVTFKSRFMRTTSPGMTLCG